MTSWALPAPEGAEAAVTAWNGEAAWFDALLDLLNSSQGEQLRRSAGGGPVSRKTLCRVALADSAAADRATGRGVTTAHETVAAALGVCPKTVQRARKVLEALGLAVTIAEGRYLTVAERAEARRLHGGHQLRAASRRALTMPRPCVEQRNVHLPRRGSVLKQSPQEINFSTRSRARKSAAWRPQPMTSGGYQEPQPLALLRLAGQLVRALPRLAQNRHVGAVAAMLQRAGIDGERWSSAESLLNRVAEGNVRRSLRRTFEAHEQKDALAYLAWQIRTSIDPAEPTPNEVAAAESARRAQATEERRAAAAAEAELRRTIDWDEVQRIIDASNREIAERNRARRYPK